jgi:hypothetical protein
MNESSKVGAIELARRVRLTPGDRLGE